MSIFDERIRSPGPAVAGDLSDYAKKDYVDAQDGLRVLKAGDTMTGDLTMRAQSRVRGLPTSKAGPRLQGDEAVSQFETVEVISGALKNFKKTIKPLITVWAENKRSMVDNRYEWSFGSDAARGYANGDYPMLTQVGSYVWVCLQQHLTAEYPALVSIFQSTGKKKVHMARPDPQVKYLVFLYLKPL